MTRLVLEGVCKSFGGLQALHDVSFTVPPGQVTSLIGPNGAGKTTCFNLITGVFAPDRGSVHLGDRRIDGLLPHQVAALGVARTFQHPRLFREMTVLENVMVGWHRRRRGGYLAAMLGLRAAREDAARARQAALECIERVGLMPWAGQRAAALSAGNQKLVELARALAGDPSLLLLDEPAAGLNDQETETLADLLTRLGDGNMTILAVEHNMDFVMTVSARVVVLNHGRKIAEGTPGEVQNDPTVLEAYLGAPDLLESIR
ncbi:MAG TPA: ABC transporter ATP-binding protein [Bacillota bacterium]